MSDSAVRNVFGDVLEDHVQKLGLCAKDSFWRRVVEELPVVKLRDVIDEDRIEDTLRAQCARERSEQALQDEAGGDEPPVQLLEFAV